MGLSLKAIFLTGFFICFFGENVPAQAGNADKLKTEIARLKQQKNYLEDTAYFKAINRLAFIYAISYPDSAITLLTGQVAQLKAIDFREGEVFAYNIFGNAYQTKGDYAKALTYFNQAYELAEKIKYRTALPIVGNNIGLVYLNLGSYPTALDKFYTALQQAESSQNRLVAGSIISNIATIHFYQGKLQESEMDYYRMLDIAKALKDTFGMALAYNNIGEVNLEQDSLSKALRNLTIAGNLARQINNPDRLVSSTKNLGLLYAKWKNYPKAIAYFDTALLLSRAENSKASTCKVLIGLATVEKKQGAYPQALAHAREAVQLAQQMGQSQQIRDASEIAAAVYEATGDGSNALKYYKLYKTYSDSISNVAGERAALTYKAEYELSRQQLEFERKAFQKNWILFSAITAFLILCIIAWIINRNRARLNTANHVLQQKNEVIEAERLKAETALQQLKTTQTQLIQAEKMASLGELTAGIAHEIQNPLNFVNNFSEVNTDLIEEMETEIAAGNMEEVKAIANDLKDNNLKIAQHGRRADGIVKGMLQHSRVSSGQKEPTDINALADEYLHLSYHGLRAKDKSFNAKMETHFDASIGKINLLPQDVGRVLLNLFNNAFYALNEKKKMLGDAFEPIISVRTKKINDKVEITVADNGNGIPENIRKKIFQPFFTTKPSGQGTGLGLSLSYDIITKSHGGTLHVESKDGEGSKFVITLPM